MANKEYVEITVFKLETEEVIQTYVINYNDREQRQKYINTLHEVIKHKDWIMEILRIDTPKDAT